MTWLGLDNKVVVVTGGAGGIGRACLAAFHEAGAKVVALDRNPDTANTLMAEMDPTGQTALAYDCDIGQPESVAMAASFVEENLGGADVVINNAGILRPAPLSEVTDDDWNDLLNINLSGSLRVTKAFCPQMVAKGKGAIVQIASIAGSHPQPASGAYSASKAAALMMVRQLAYEWGPKGIRTNSISPGLVMTPLSAAFYADAKVKEARENMVPSRRIGDPDDMANTAVFLASDRAGYINGQDITIDGGLSQALMGLVPRPGY